MISKKDFRECLADGSWSNAAPVCEATICPPPFPIRNGTFHPLKDEYTYLDSVRYSCDDPKKFMNGEGSIYCNQNGSWSSPPPECVAVDCPIPNVPYSRKISGFTTPYSLNSVVIFDCYNGFRMNGTSTVKCNIKSEWEPSLPDCLAAYCKEPTLINGYTTGTPTSFHDTLEKGYNVGDTIQMKCNTWYSLKGDYKITCGSDFMWSPAVPICEKSLGCSSPVISNGQVILKNNKEYIPEIDGHAFSDGDTIQIMCDPGFIIKGSETSECDYKYLKARYIWTPQLPVCVPAKN
ncbi:complement component receptor 1-like protein [Pelobates fuscus]|uniref:complement component receptor 1-like protein n=1 Tax=Pelobates fuscus TaxID=191477 RepID=UPI002FE4311C